MGNRQTNCCHQCDNSAEQLPPIKVQSMTTSVRSEIIKLPALSYQVSQHLSQYQPFHAELSRNASIRRYGNDIYQGQLNYKIKPHGFGTMYFQNGAVFIGQFDNGKAHGLGHFVFVDGSFFHGQMKANQADCINGEYNCQQFSYHGGFKANMFEGRGEEKGKSHTFSGLYHKNNKVEGTLNWQQMQYDLQGKIKQTTNKSYTGQFDQNNQFHGQGKLINEYGEYSGNFQHGKKHGKGQFTFKSGIKYVGDYSNGVRQGTGTLYTKANKIAFSGQVRDGLPHGKGYVMNTYGDKVYLTWVIGLDQRLLEKTERSERTQQALGIIL